MDDSLPLVTKDDCRPLYAQARPQSDTASTPDSLTTPRSAPDLAGEHLIPDSLRVLADRMIEIEEDNSCPDLNENERKCIKGALRINACYKILDIRCMADVGRMLHDVGFENWKELTAWRREELIALRGLFGEKECL